MVWEKEFDVDFDGYIGSGYPRSPQEYLNFGYTSYSCDYAVSMDFLEGNMLFLYLQGVVE